MTAILVGVILMAAAQSVGAIHSQSQIEINPMPPAPQIENLQTLPDTRGGVLEIPRLPAGFDGCWTGQISGPPEHFEYLGGPRVAGWYRTEVEFCFKQNPKGVQVTRQDFRLDEADAIRQGYPVHGYHASFRLVESNRDTVLIQGVSAFDEEAKLFGFIPNRVTITESSYAVCTLEGDAMRCTTRTLSLIGRQGTPWNRSLRRVELRRDNGHSGRGRCESAT